MLVVEADGRPSAGLHEAVRVCEKLRISLTQFAGADGFASLLRRSMALARVEVPSLNNVTVKPDCSMEGLEALADDDTDGGVAAATALTAQMLGLLDTFIGEPLTLRLVQDGWPDELLDVEEI
ncbi:MAG: hypothetical protein ACR2HJ_05655 [Fimbriimonadales bacterium]